MAISIDKQIENCKNQIKKYNQKLIKLEEIKTEMILKKIKNQDVKIIEKLVKQQKTKEEIIDILNDKNF